MPDSITKFSLRQLPDGIYTSGTIAGPNAWRFDQSFVEPVDGIRCFFSLVDPYIPDKILVFKDGKKMIQGQEITLHPTNIVEFATAPTLTPLQRIEAWYMVPGASDISYWRVDETLTGPKNGINKRFTTEFPYVSSRLLVFKNGLKQIKGVTLNFVEIDQTTIEFILAPQVTDFLEISYFILV